MKVVLDTNVLVSALLNPFGAPAAVLNLFVEEKIVLCYDTRILTEYREVLLRERFGFSTTMVDALLDFIHTTAETVTPVRYDITLKDPDDQPFVDVAVSTAANFLITGNIKHFPKKIGPTSVILPGDFIKLDLNRK